MDVEIEDQRPPEIDEPEPKKKAKGGAFTDLLNRASDNLTKITGVGSSPETDDDAPKKKRRSPKSDRPGYVRPGKRKEISTLVTGAITVLIMAWDVPEEIKPDDDELQAISGYATSLLLRHVNIASKLNADVLDVIGLLAVLSGWFARTRDARQVYANQKRAEAERLQAERARVEFKNDRSPTIAEAQNERPNYDGAE